MEPIVLELRPGMSPAEMVALLRNGGLARGSAVRIQRKRGLSEPDWSSLVILVLAAIEFVTLIKRSSERPSDVEAIADKAVAAKVADEAWSEALMKRVFDGDGNVVAMEQDVEHLTGVTIQIDEEEEEWPTAGMYLLNRAYGDDEPDISGLIAREPNPDYRP